MKIVYSKNVTTGYRTTLKLGPTLTGQPTQSQIHLTCCNNLNLSFKVNATVPKGSYGKVEMSFVSSFFTARGMLLKSLQASSVRSHS